MRRRILEALVLLSSVAVLVAALGPNPIVQPDLRELAIDGLYPGMPVSQVSAKVMYPSTVYGVGRPDPSTVRFVVGESLTFEGIPYLKRGDTKEHARELLGPPDEVVGNLWQYHETYTLRFRQDRLTMVCSDTFYRSLEDYYYIQCQGWSHALPGFYAFVGSTVGGTETLILTSDFRLASSRFINNSWSGERVILDEGTIRIGQSPGSVAEMLPNRESVIVEHGYVYKFDNFTLRLGLQNEVVSKYLSNRAPSALVPGGFSSWSTPISKVEECQ